jgi:hypothetical protein
LPTPATMKILNELLSAAIIRIVQISDFPLLWYAYIAISITSLKWRINSHRTSAGETNTQSEYHRYQQS